MNESSAPRTCMTPEGGCPEWSVGIISSRESPEILASALRAAVAACGDRRAIVDVLVNGNAVLARETATFAASLSGKVADTILLRVWSVALGDKAHAWNLLVHEIEPGAKVAFFVDGYVSVMPDAFALLAEALDRQPESLGASGVPTDGRSASKLREQMLAVGGLHGNMFAIRGSIMNALRNRGIRLPLGLYRTDATIGAVLCFALDPERQQWDSHRILVHPQATWRIAQAPPNRRAALVSHFRRRLRQARGTLENLAVRQHLAIDRRSPADLPLLANDLVTSWAARARSRAVKACLRNPLCLLAWRSMHKARDWSARSAAIELLASVPPDQPQSEADRAS